MTTVKKMVMTAICVALCVVLPMLFHWIPNAGSVILPMHIPVLLCGFTCGSPWGAVVGMISPIMRSVLTGGFPPMFPTAVAMSVELATYGFVSGFLARRLPKHPGGIYGALIGAMLCGRIVWGAAMAFITLNGNGFTFAAFVAGAFTNAIPGIILQLVSIPAIVFTLNRIQKTPSEV